MGRDQSEFSCDGKVSHGKMDDLVKLSLGAQFLSDEQVVVWLTTELGRRGLHEVANGVVLQLTEQIRRCPHIAAYLLLIPVN